MREQKFELMIYALMIAVVLVMVLPSLADAQTRCTLDQLRMQAEWMDGRWQNTYEAQGHTVEIDCPIIVPDALKMPVLTVERLKPSKEAFDRVIAAGEKVMPQNPRFFLTLEDGSIQIVRFATNGAGMTEDYENCQEVWIQQGEYEMIQSDQPMKGYMVIQENGYAWEFPADEPLADGNSHTVSDGETFLRRWIETYYPDEKIDVQLKTVSVYSPRRTQDIRAGKTSRETGTDVYEGAYVFSYEQLLEGIPLYHPVSTYYVNTEEAWNSAQAERRLRPFCEGAHNAETRIDLRFKNESWFYALIKAARVREIVHEDVPLAPLEEIIASLEEKIAEGKITDVLALRLGYVLYSDPDTTAFAWAVPCWLADCMTKENGKDGGLGSDGAQFWNQWEFASVPVNAQTAETIYYGTPTEEIYALPEILTW